MASRGVFMFVGGLECCDMCPRLSCDMCQILGCDMCLILDCDMCPRLSHD